MNNVINFKINAKRTHTNQNKHEKLIEIDKSENVQIC